MSSTHEANYIRNGSLENSDSYATLTCDHTSHGESTTQLQSQRYKNKVFYSLLDFNDNIAHQENCCVVGVNHSSSKLHDNGPQFHFNLLPFPGPFNHHCLRNYLETKCKYNYVGFCVTHALLILSFELIDDSLELGLDVS